jgi:hypothetical protein
MLESYDFLILFNLLSDSASEGKSKNNKNTGIRVLKILDIVFNDKVIL